MGEDRPVSTTPLHDLWATYVAQTVARYMDRVHAWEIWNEPNVPVFWSGTTQEYAALLVVTADTIKAVDPIARILAPAVSGVDEARPWLEAIRSLNALHKFDVLALHVYTEPNFLNDLMFSYFAGLENLVNLAAEFGRKPIWITEFGFGSS